MIPHILAFSSFLKLNSMGREGLLSLWARPGEAGLLAAEGGLRWGEPGGRSKRLGSPPEDPLVIAKPAWTRRTAARETSWSHTPRNVIIRRSGRVGPGDRKIVLPRQGPEWGRAGGEAGLTARCLSHP